MKKVLAILISYFLVLSLIIGCTPKKEVKTITEKQIISFKTIEEEDPTLPKGEEKVTQKGQTGEKIITYKATYENNKLKSKEKISEKITKKSINMVVVIGTQIIEKVTEKIPYGTKYINDSSLEQGKEEVRQQGVEGEKEKTFKVGYKAGQEVSRELVSDIITIEPVSKLIAKGTKKPASAPQPGTEQMVYLSSSGERYHREGCITSKENRTLVTLSEAKARGATPCSVCDAPL